MNDPFSRIKQGRDGWYVDDGSPVPDGPYRTEIDAIAALGRVMEYEAQRPTMLGPRWGDPTKP